MTIAAPQAFRWTREMYDRMVDEGILGPHTRVQLIDRTRKQRIYARNAIPEYWIVNLAEAALEVHRDPRGEAYEARRELKGGDTIVPVAWDGGPLAVTELLP